ncbi:hypothetical protein [Micromonospora saelicesensis]|uniref:Uncharacterized protein n=1 Tax=Micromonospora saelicesensis TaxID=285676 RepID=A0A1C4W873_9ACTN|nr:hypothetical protein [Micromonospora saelicesensis]RAO60012.1 hypothetical protein PSN01_02433 [Micromonospora saelicesensis]SCE92395.1 hypothetical protein GA0070561_2465 [Micromonospora saelicesensis]
MRAPIVAPGVLLAGAGLGAVLTVVTLLPASVGLAAAIGLLCAGAFLLVLANARPVRSHRAPATSTTPPR